MGRLSRRLLLVLALPLALLMAAYAPDRAAEASIRRVRGAVVPRRDGSHVLLLSALRQLRDPTLTSFFYQLVQHEDPQVRIHAILGLGELDQSGEIDPWLVRQLDPPNARYAVIANALANELLETDRIKTLLSADDLEPASRVLLSAALVERGEPVNREDLLGLADNPNLTTAGLAACLLAEAGDADAQNAYRARLASLSKANRTRHLVEMFDLVAVYGLTAVLDWVVEVLTEPKADPAVVEAGLSTVLKLDPSRGVALWTRALGDDPPYSLRVRYALVLLAAGRGVQATAYDRLPPGDPLIDRMVAAGKARSEGADMCPALIELLKLGHPTSARWALKVLEDLDDEQAACVCLYLVDSVEGDPQGRDGRVEMAITASARLLQIDHETLIRRLLRAEDDGLTQQAILMGLLKSRSPVAGVAARQVKRIGFGRADSVALILIAKHAEQLTPQELSDLGVIASGGGRISAVLQTQAAWLYLKHTKKIDQALADTFADAETHAPPGP
jgi:hypothetical protein